MINDKKFAYVVLSIFYILSIFSTNYIFTSELLGFSYEKSGNWPELVYYILIFISIIVFYEIILNRSKPILPKTLLIYLSLTILFSSINSLFQNSFIPALNFTLLALSILIIYSYIYNKTIKKNDFNFITYIMLINLVLLVISYLFGHSKIYDYSLLKNVEFNRPFIQDGFTWFRYQGIFAGANSLGRIFALSYIISIIYFLEKGINGKLFITSLIIIIGSILMVFASNSRTALLISASVTLFYLYYRNNIDKASLVKLIKKPSIFILLILLLIISLSIGFSGLDAALSKFTESSWKGISSNRFMFWSEAFKHINIVGYQDFLSETTVCSRYKSERVCGVHNNYIHQMLKFGIIPAFLFTLIIFYHLFSGIKNYKNNNSFYGIICSSMALYLLIFYIFV